MLCLLALLLLPAACALTPARQEPAAAPARPWPVLLIGIDGFRPDYLALPEARTLRRLAAEGVVADAMQPSYPTLTFPNHYTLVTGLHPDRHGIINNSMRDPFLGRFAMHLRDAVADGRWWQGEPVWNTAARHGLRSATLFWPGSEADIQGRQPEDWLPFDARMPLRARVRQVLDWLARPESTRPHFLTLYFEQIDSAGHDAGPASEAVRRAIMQVDAALAELLDGLEAGGWAGRIQLVIVADHGMASIDETRPILLDDLLDAESFELHSYGASAGIQPHPDRAAEVEGALLREHPNMRCFRRGEFPESWRYGEHPRIPEITCQAEPPFRIGLRRMTLQPGRSLKYGGHGFAPDLPEMQALFVAHGPAFVPGSRLQQVHAVDVYALLCHLLGIEPATHQGNPQAFDSALRSGD